MVAACRRESGYRAAVVGLLLMAGCGPAEIGASPWSAPERVSDDRGRYVLEPSAAAHPEGVHLVWIQGDIDDEALRARHFDVRTNRWEPIRELGPISSAPSLAADAAGNAVVVWDEDADDEDLVWAARYERANDRWGEPTQLDAGGEAPHVAMGADGSALAVWTHFGEGEVQLFAAHMTPDGAWGSPLPIGAAQVQTLQAGVVMHGDGDATVFMVQRVVNDEGVWEGQLAALRYLKDRDEWSQAVGLQRAERGEYFDVSLAGNARGDAVLFWSVESSDGWEHPWIYTATHENGSGVWTKPDKLGTRYPFRSAVSMDDEGRTTAACSYGGGSIIGLSAYELDEDGGLGTSEDLVSREDGGVSDPAVLALEGRVMIVWSEGDGLDENTMRSRTLRGGSWQAPEVVGPIRNGLADPQLVGIPDVGVLAYWTTSHELVASWHP